MISNRPPDQRPFLELIAGHGVLHVHRHVTSAEILAMGTTPIVLVPAPGANKLTVLVSGLFRYSPGSIAYSGVDADQYPAPLASGDAIYDLPFGNILTDLGLPAVSGPLQVPGIADSSNFNTAAWINAPLVLNNSAANPTAGNGTLDIDLWYVVVDVS